jgi:hypothetical protein
MKKPLYTHRTHSFEDHSSVETFHTEYQDFGKKEGKVVGILSSFLPDLKISREEGTGV